MAEKKSALLLVLTSVFCGMCFKLCCAQYDTSEIKLRIDPWQESLPRPAGESLSVTCNGDAIDPNLFTEMKWIGPAGEIGNNEKDPITVINLEKGKLLLVFSEPTPEMSGKYTCTAVYDNSLIREDSIVITFFHSISFENCPEQQVVIIGREGRIRCQVNSYPAAAVQWYKSGRILDKETVVLENDGIVIKEVKKSDSGTYRIRAILQSFGSLKWKEIKVKVHVPPVIGEEMESVVVVDGGRNEIICKTIAFPSPMYSWFNPRLQNLSDVDNFIVNRTTGTLTFRQVLKEDAGIYKCVASNEVGTVERFVNVKIIDLLCPDLFSPILGSLEGSCKRAKVGETCSFRCIGGFDLIGTKSLTCEASGLWSGEQPSCTGKSKRSCPSLVRPGNGSMLGVCTDAQPGHSCSFACDQGFRLRGQSSLYCLFNNEWSASTPTCQAVLCPDLLPPEGWITMGRCRNAVPGNQCFIICRPQFFITGSPVINCREDGSWDYWPPICSAQPVLKDCPVKEKNT